MDNERADQLAWLEPISTRISFLEKLEAILGLPQGGHDRNQLLPADFVCRPVTDQSYFEHWSLDLIDLKMVVW